MLECIFDPGCYGASGFFYFCNRQGIINTLNFVTAEHKHLRHPSVQTHAAHIMLPMYIVAVWSTPSSIALINSASLTRLKQHSSMRRSSHTTYARTLTSALVDVPKFRRSFEWFLAF